MRIATLVMTTAALVGCASDGSPELGKVDATTGTTYAVTVRERDYLCPVLLPQIDRFVADDVTGTATLITGDWEVTAPWGPDSYGMGWMSWNPDAEYPYLDTTPASDYRMAESGFKWSDDGSHLSGQFVWFWATGNKLCVTYADLWPT